jgi:hypothetical protein
MKFHNGKRRINKVDGGKKRAKKQYHKKIREADKEEVSTPIVSDDKRN